MNDLHDHDHAQATPARPGALALRRFRLFFVVVMYMLALSLLKAAIHWFDLEFLALNALFTSAIAGSVFIIGFLLSSVLGDYKEAERMPSDIRVALEAIHDDCAAFAARQQCGAAKDVPKILLGFLGDLRRALGPGCNHQHLAPAIDRIDQLTPSFAEMELDGMPPNYIVRLRAEQGVLRRCLFRIYYIQKIQFVPSVHILVQSLVGAILFLLLFLKTEGSPENAIIFGAISYMFIYVLGLIATLEQPFRRGSGSLDDVSFFLLTEFEEKLERASDRARAIMIPPDA